MSVSDPGEPVWQAISASVSACTNQRFAIDRIRTVAGGCINTAVVIEGGDSSYFVKLNSAQSEHMFEAEADGLRELAGADALRVPLPVCCGENDGHAWLVLENLGKLGCSAVSDWGQLGRGLASMHRCRHDLYGWYRDNTIGSTAQINSGSDNWLEFLRNHRIGYQLDLAAHNGHGKQLQSRGNALLDNLAFFFAGYAPHASLLHGDLWSGNIGFLADGEPVLFDPAVYFGDRETDIAMTGLFGGFAPDFYRAYQTAWPLDKGFMQRKHLYNFYHVLNHLNLFGQGYLAKCESTLDHLLAEVG